MTNTMQKLKETVQRYRKELIIAFAVFLISTTSFAFGYLAARNERAPIIIEQCNTSGNDNPQQ
jgi:hypothetical protein